MMKATRWMDAITETINMPLRTLKTQTEDRTFWRNTINMVARSQNQLDSIEIYCINKKNNVKPKNNMLQLGIL